MYGTVFEVTMGNKKVMVRKIKVLHRKCVFVLSTMITTSNRIVYISKLLISNFLCSHHKMIGDI